MIWRDGKAKVTITTETDYKIEYKINGTDENTWIEATGDEKAVTVTNLSHGDMVYVRLTDGTNVGQYATIEIVDTEKPNEFTITVTDITEVGCTVLGSTTDEQTGLKDYTYVAEPTAGGELIKAENIADTTYTFTTLEEGTEYKVYMIAYDNAGNERKSNEVTITTESKSEFEKAKDDSMFDKTENTKIEDKNGNLITIPAGFKIKDDENAETVDKGIVIIDRNENEFVWIPVGTIYTDEAKTEANAKKIELNRYTFDEDGKPTAQNDSVIERYYQELETSIKENITAKSITDFKNSVRENKGYYIGRYEARTDGSGNTTEKGTDTVYTPGSQPNAATAARNMYDSKKPFVSDLINSYAWDTATLFLQTCGTNPKYSRQKSVNTRIEGKALTGTNNQEVKDVECNVYDMASNLMEYSTEFCNYSSGRNTARGDEYSNSSFYTSVRYGSSNADSYSKGFRPIIYIEEKTTSIE